METLDSKTLINVFFGRQPGGITRILPTLTFAFDYWHAGGLNPVAFKITNIVIHGLTVLALAGFFRTLLFVNNNDRTRIGLIALGLSMAWAIHPLQVSSVLYVVQRMQTMCTLFVVLALWSYLKARQAQIEGKSGRTALLLTILLWALALGCKEDAALLPAYTLALELTVLRFRAADPGLALRLRKGYLLSILAGAALFLFVVIPNYWSWDKYPGRDFSTSERLLTQARVLCMYLWEIVLPLPQHMPFFYDWIQPSHGLLHPWTTLPAILFLMTLLMMALMLRIRRPLFALGVFWFFSGHFITSNVVSLELAFEHRNHFPLIGMVLAIGDLLILSIRLLRFRPAMQAWGCAVILASMGTATVARARSWSDPLALASTSTMLAPYSARAWNALSLYYFTLGGEDVPNNPYLDQAIDACAQGAVNAPYSSACLTNLVVFKTLRGTITPTDWSRYIERLQRVNMGPENSLAVWVLITNIRKGVALDENSALEAIDIVTRRGQFNTNQFAAIGYFILGRLHKPERAYPYFAKYIQSAPPNDAVTDEIISELKKEGRVEWADRLETLAQSRNKQSSVPKSYAH